VTESELLTAFREAFEEANRAWNAGDLETAYAALPEELEYRLSPIWPEARLLRSRDEVVAFFQSFQATFPDARTTPYEYVEPVPGTVIVGSHVTGTGRSSGAEAEMEIWQIWQVRTEENGRTVTSVTEYNSRREAMEAAGIREPSGQGAE
jgi:ketosteroid isomerase-like protein